VDDNIIRSNIGRISDELQLPVKHVWSSKTDTDHQFVKLKLGPLKCTQGIYEYHLYNIFEKINHLTFTGRYKTIDNNNIYGDKCNTYISYIVSKQINKNYS